MPIYEYRCSHCGELFERLVRISDTGKKQDCPKCGSQETNKAVSAFATSGSTRALDAGGGGGGGGCSSHGGFS